ncbi:MAG TPA: hypothetical protein VK279_13560 [Solirubrobacteraceae bacterium]|nr:hypothetical protein [Solirubrobacteraceae bacterium]
MARALPAGSVIVVEATPRRGRLRRGGPLALTVAGILLGLAGVAAAVAAAVALTSASDAALLREVVNAVAGLAGGDPVVAPGEEAARPWLYATLIAGAVGGAVGLGLLLLGASWAAKRAAAAGLRAARRVVAPAEDRRALAPTTPGRVPKLGDPAGLPPGGLALPPGPVGR